MNDNHDLTDKQKRLVELLLEGCNYNECARVLGVNRKTIYAWRDKPEVKAELDKGRQAMKNTVEQTILVNIEPLVQRLLQIATTSKSDKTSLDAIMYCINRLCGSPTNKNLNVNEEVQNDKGEISWDDLNEYMNNNEDNVIELKDAK